MRLNLVLVLALLALISVAATFSPDPTKARWTQACADGVSFSLRSGGNYCQWLEIDGARYRLCDGCSTSTEVFERGRVYSVGERLVLTFDQGKQKEYDLTQGGGRWWLRDGQGEAYEQDRETQNRLHPSPEWLIQGKPLELEFDPPCPAAQSHACKPVTPSQNNWLMPSIELPVFSFGLNGCRLKQGGRELLNRRSTRGDVENLLGPLEWTVLEGATNHGTSAQARRGKLLIRVRGIVGSTPDEARVTGFAFDNGLGSAK